MADVFISYKREDRAWAERVDVALRAERLSTWWDTSLIAGEHFSEAIDRELKAARCVVVLWSEAARASRWVQAEAVSGFDRGILVAARLDDVRLGYPFDVVQTVMISDADGVARIVAGVRLKLGVAAQSPALQPDSKVPGNSNISKWIHRATYLRWIGITLVAIVVAGSGVFDLLARMQMFAFVSVGAVVGCKIFDLGLHRIAGNWTSLLAVLVGFFSAATLFLWLMLSGNRPFNGGPSGWFDWLALTVSSVVYATLCWGTGRILRVRRWA